MALILSFWDASSMETIPEMILKSNFYSFICFINFCPRIFFKGWNLRLVIHFAKCDCYYNFCYIHVIMNRKIMHMYLYWNEIICEKVRQFLWILLNVKLFQVVYQILEGRENWTSQTIYDFSWDRDHPKTIPTIVVSYSSLLSAIHLKMETVFDQSFITIYPIIHMKILF